MIKLIKNELILKDLLINEIIFFISIKPSKYMIFNRSITIKSNYKLRYPKLSRLESITINLLNCSSKVNTYYPNIALLGPIRPKNRCLKQFWPINVCDRPVNFGFSNVHQLKEAIIY